MGKLVDFALLLNRLEQAFLQDNVQAFRHTLNEAHMLMQSIPGERVPVRDLVFLADRDGCEHAL